MMELPRGFRVRPIDEAEDAFDAAAILKQAATDDLAGVRELEPAGTTPKPVEIAEDGTAAVFEIYAGTKWESTASGALPISRVLLRL